MEKNSPKNQVIAQLKEVTNVLVTVSNNPSVDQLAGAIGITLFLNHLGKHATAVFSGEIPSTLEFLQPEKTLEKTTDSLRDFIIALDKSKADKLRYKVEDEYVRIFITPYRTSISDKDLEFSQGDFNVETVLALGVNSREELDAAIVAHGRILHDATVMSVTNQEQPSNLGTIDWNEQSASSLSEMMVDVAGIMKKDSLDEQMATAFLTGVVAETDRFRNDKTTPHTMSISGALMAAGANSQLVATQLETKPPEPETVPDAIPEPTPEQPNNDTPPEQQEHGDNADKVNSNQLDSHNDVATQAEHPEPEPESTPEEPTDDGSLHIDHSDYSYDPEDTNESEAADGKRLSAIHIDDEGRLHHGQHGKDGTQSPAGSGSKRIIEPPSRGSKLTANTEPEHAQLDPATDPLSLPPIDGPLLGHDGARHGAATSGHRETLHDIEESVHSPHLSQFGQDMNDAHDEAEKQQSDGARSDDQQGNDTPPPPVPPPMMPPFSTPPRSDQDDDSTL